MMSSAYVAKENQTQTRFGESTPLNKISSDAIIDMKRYNQTISGHKHVHFDGNRKRPISPFQSSFTYGFPEAKKENKRLVAAGGTITSLDEVRKVTTGNCKELEQFVANVKGRIPIFGYPMISYSPPNTNRKLTDRKTWRIAKLSDGKITSESNLLFI